MLTFHCTRKNGNQPQADLQQGEATNPAR
jgi:hypothetical protein